MDLDRAAKAAGLLGAVAAIPFVFTLTRRATGSATLALAASLLLAFFPMQSAWACSGMESTLFAAVLACGAWALAADQRLPGGVPLDAVIFGFSIWIRPEGFLFAAVALLLRLTDGAPRRASTALLWLAGAGALAVPFWLGRWSYFGDPLPDTFYAKSFDWQTRLAGGANMLREFATEAGPVVVVPLLLAFVPRKGRSPALRFPRWASLAALLIVGGAALFAARDTAAITRPGQFGANYVVDNARNIQQVNLPLGRWLREHAAPGQRLATWDIGGIGYESRLPILDLYGLTDRTLARLTASRAPEERKIEYFERSRPELFVTYDWGEISPWFWLAPARQDVLAHYRRHSRWRARTGGYALVLMTREDVALPAPPPEKAESAPTVRVPSERIPGITSAP